MKAALTVEEFCKSLSTAEWDEAEAIEVKLHEVMSVGLTEATAIQFVRTVMAARKVMPSVTVVGVFDTALGIGLSYLGDAGTLTRLRKGQFAWATNGIKPKKRGSNTQKSSLK